MTKTYKLKEVGLKKHLDLTTDKHRGLDFHVFIAMVDARASVASMARTFKVSYETMNKWLRLYELEQKNK